MPEGLRVLVVDDDPFTRATLVPALAAGGVGVVAQASTAREAMAAARQTLPDAAVVDLDLGEGPTGVDLAQALRRVLPRVGIVVISTYAEPRLIGANLGPLPQGSRYLVKQEIVDIGDLVAALRESIDLGPSRARSLPATELSSGQLEVLRLVAAGYSNREIARRRVVTEATIEKAVARLIRQLGITVAADQNARVLLTRAYRELTGGQDART